MTSPHIGNIFQAITGRNLQVNYPPNLVPICLLPVQPGPSTVYLYTLPSLDIFVCDV